MSPNAATDFAIGDRKEFGAHIEAVIQNETTDEFAAELYVGDLVFAYGDGECFAGVGVHDDVGGLQSRVAEEAVGVEIFVGDVVDLLFVGGDAFEPAERA